MLLLTLFAHLTLGVIRVASVGYDRTRVDFTNLEPSEDEFLTTKAIVRGMAASLVKRL